VVFINPEITWTSDETTTEVEGCLSFPGIQVPITRPQKIYIQAINLDGNVFGGEAQGFYARALQHEHDHLNGKLMIDFVGSRKKDMITRKLIKRTRLIAHHLDH
jgi:peptide deformylase